MNRFSSKRPKMLYRTDPSFREIERCEVPDDLSPTIELENDFGIVWRVRDLDRHLDFHGYDTLKAAKTETVSQVKSEIYRLQDYLKKLTGEP